MKVNIIVAHDKNRVIGNKGDLPWNIPEDMKYFKKMTEGSTVIMGRKTMESIGKALPNRENIVVSRSGKCKADGKFTIARSVEDAIHKFLYRWHGSRPVYEPSEVWIIGGGEIYTEALPYCDNLYVTEVDAEFDGDTYFPPYNDDFTPILKSLYKNKDGLNYRFITYKKNAL